MDFNIHIVTILAITVPVHGLSGNATVSVLENKVQHFIESAGDFTHSTIYMRPDEIQLIACETGSHAAETFDWTLNGTSLPSLEGNLLVCKNNMKVLANGTLYVKNFVTECDGHYQCLATSQTGTILAPFISLYLAIAFPFSGQEGSPPHERRANMYQYLYLPCHDLDGGIPHSLPPYKIKWYHKCHFAESETEVDNNERIAIDPEGKIHFLWVSNMDHNCSYRCSGYNEVLLTECKNTKSYILKVNYATFTYKPPSLVFNKDVKAMVNREASLFCIFNYVPMESKRMMTAWEKDGTEIRTSQKYEIRAFGRQLVVKNVGLGNENIEETYTCKGTQPGDNTVEGRVKLTIVSQPLFVAGGELTNKEAYIGSSIEFTCKTHSYQSWNRPAIWMKNGEPINDPCGKGLRFCEKCVSLGELCARPMCAYPKFTCVDRSACISQTEVCDEDINCKDESDELFCPESPEKKYGRFTISGDRTQLILNNVTGDDNMCFQCLVENPYGKLLRNGCLLVRENNRCYYRNGICMYCITGYFGLQCDLRCNKNCEDGCDRTNGRCKTCKYGFFGTFCQQECPDYCKRLNKTDHTFCGNGLCNSTSALESNVCHRINGTCSMGCKIPAHEYCNKVDYHDNVTVTADLVTEGLFYAGEFVIFGVVLASTCIGLTLLIVILAGMIYFGRWLALHVDPAKNVYEVAGQNMTNEMTSERFNRRYGFSGIYNVIRDSLVHIALPRNNTSDANVGTDYAYVNPSCRRAPTAHSGFHETAGISSTEVSERNAEPPPIPPRDDMMYEDLDRPCHRAESYDEVTSVLLNSPSDKTEDNYIDFDLRDTTTGNVRAIIQTSETYNVAEEKGAKNVSSTMRASEQTKGPSRPHTIQWLYSSSP